MNLGPFHFTTDVSIGTIASLAVLVTMAFKLFRHLNRVDDRVRDLWTAVMGEGPQDTRSFFYRFAIMETRVTEMWERLQFNKLVDRRSAPRD
jgi:hypothetical protein